MSASSVPRTPARSATYRPLGPCRRGATGRQSRSAATRAPHREGLHGELARHGRGSGHDGSRGLRDLARRSTRSRGGPAGGGDLPARRGDRPPGPGGDALRRARPARGGRTALPRRRTPCRAPLLSAPASGRAPKRAPKPAPKPARSRAPSPPHRSTAAAPAPPAPPPHAQHAPARGPTHRPAHRPAHSTAPGPGGPPDAGHPARTTGPDPARRRAPARRDGQAAQPPAAGPRHPPRPRDEARDG